jgi:hypothetical protein
MSMPVKVTAPETIHGAAGTPETYARDAFVKEAVWVDGFQVAVMAP